MMLCRVQRRAILFQALWEREMEVIPMDLVILVIIHHHHTLMDFHLILAVHLCMDTLIILDLMDHQDMDITITMRHLMAILMVHLHLIITLMVDGITTLKG